MLILALRSPTFLPDAVFENHIALWVGLVAIAAALFFVARRQADRRLLLAGQLLLALTLLWIITAQLFDTPAERLYKAHVALADAASKTDLDRMLSFLDPDFTAPSLEIYPGTGNVLAAAKNEISARLKDYGIKESTITSYSVALHPNHTALTHISVLTLTDAGSIPTSWQLTWTDNPSSDWKITRADFLPLQGAPTVIPR